MLIGIVGFYLSTEFYFIGNMKVDSHQKRLFSRGLIYQVFFSFFGNIFHYTIQVRFYSNQSLTAPCNCYIFFCIVECNLFTIL